MKNFICRKNIKLNKENVIKLFESYNSLSLEYKNKLFIAIKNANYNFSIWNGEELIGLLTAISDKSCNVIITYFLVHSDYQNQGLERIMIQDFSNTFSNFEKQIFVSENQSYDFLKELNFKKVEAFLRQNC